jgi:D-sedoheptulose 7-phosphate isomerase
MNNVESIVLESNNIQQFAKSYFIYLTKLLDEIDTDAIESFKEVLEIACKNERTIFIAGNGGSASTASHIANDIGLDVMKKSDIDHPFRVLALTDNVSVITAIGNDNGYDNIFLYQLKTLYRPGDILVVISASGNSPNVVNAAQWVKQQGGTVLGLIGFDGGRLKRICDTVIHVKTPKGEYGPVEDIHLIIDHLLSFWLQYKVKRKEKSNVSIKRR